MRNAGHTVSCHEGNCHNQMRLGLGVTSCQGALYQLQK